jgi:aminodeoxyfutalosine synthase
MAILDPFATLAKAPSHDVSFTDLFSQIQDPKLKNIANDVISSNRLTNEQGLYLLTQASSNELQKLADFKREQMVGSQVRYATTLFIHPTNLCELSCPMCSFYAKPGWKSAWFLTPEAVEEKVKKHLHQNLNEIHVVGGLWKDADLNYYQDMFSRIKRLDPSLHIKAMTPVEYDYLANLHGISVKEVFEKMMSWGLGSLPGGGAEILVEEIRKQVAPQKISSDRYLEIHEMAHSLGLHSNITMLYGHVEDPVHIITHLDRVRRLQDRTGGFKTFVPLKYHLENNALGKRTQRIKPKSFQRIYAVSRLMLDNIFHLKVLWNYLGIEEGLEALKWGGNDLGSTALDEKIIKMAGGVDITMSSGGMEQLIRGQNREPKRCHSGDFA